MKSIDHRLKIAILTTKTPHHLYFIQQLKELCSDIVSIDLVLIEEKPFPYRKLFRSHIVRNWFNPIQWSLLNPYLQCPYRVNEQTGYEMDRFFPDGGYDYDLDMRVERVASVNNTKSYNLLKGVNPDIALVYGTGRVKSDIFQIPTISTVNLHGGYLPDYRGLDTNLWAALHGDFDKLAVALHSMDENFDTGPIYMMERLQPQHDISIATIRYYTTLLATDMCVRLLREMAESVVEPENQPVGEGKYYSYVPWILKPLVDWKLSRYARMVVND